MVFMSNCQCFEGINCVLADLGTWMCKIDNHLFNSKNVANSLDVMSEVKTKSLQNLSWFN